VTQRAAVEMLKQGSGHIVNITTSLVDQADARITAGRASITKGGLNSVTKGLAIEFAKTGVRVNAVAPGIIKTRCIRSRRTKSWVGCIRSVGCRHLGAHDALGCDEHKSKMR